MNERIKELRKQLGLTQEEFASRLSLSRNYIAQIEIGTKVPSERTISDICREYNINEEWLRYGTGEMNKPRTDKLATYLAEISNGNDEFIQDIIEVYMSLDKSSKEALRTIAMRMADKISNKDK